MPILLAANNANSTLAGSISNTATTANLAAGSGVFFPSPTNGQYFLGTFTSASNNQLRENVQVTGVSGDAITIVRAQEGTTALAWNAGDLFVNQMTARTLEQLAQVFVYAGNPNGNVAGVAAGGGLPPTLAFNSTNGTWWTCVATGSSSTAVWQALAPVIGGLGEQQYSVHGTSPFIAAITGWHFVKVWAAGGGGGAAASSSASSGAGGGEYREGPVYLTEGQTVTVTVGQGGTGGANTGTNGTDGGNSSFGSYIIANGGKHSAGAAGTINNSFGAGGTGGSGGGFSQPGAPGGQTTDLSVITINGMGGASFASGNAMFGIGTNGIQPGVGGSGYCGAGVGGTGADGTVAVAW